jgi:hypothetical protein
MKLAVYTLIDITSTGILSNDQAVKKERNQQRNWDTALQIISLRNHCRIIAHPSSPQTVNLNLHDFGSDYTGEQRCWKFIFETETDQDLEILSRDFDSVPVIIGLTETVVLDQPVFVAHGTQKNMYIKILGYEG